MGFLDYALNSFNPYQGGFGGPSYEAQQADAARNAAAATIGRRRQPEDPNGPNWLGTLLQSIGGATRTGDPLQDAGTAAMAQYGAGMPGFAPAPAPQWMNPLAPQAPPQPVPLAPLPPPISIGSGQPIPPQQQPQEASLPPNAQPTGGQIAPQPQPGPDFGQRMLAGANNFSDPSAGLIGRIANSIHGARTGQNTNPAYGSKLQETGTDLMGNKSFAWVNPIAQTMRPATMQGAVGVGATADLQAALAMPTRYNEHGRDQAFLDALDPTTKSVVQSILDGNSSVTPRNLQRFLPLATRAEKDFVGQTYQTRLKGYQDFYGGGKSSEIMRKTNQSALHFGELVTDKMSALPGHAVPAANVLENFVQTNLLGHDAQGNFEVNAHALADELSTMFKGAGISDAEIRAWESRLSPNMSKEQQRGMAKTLLNLYEDSVTALEKKRQESVGPTIAAQKGEILGPEAKASIEKIRKFIGGQNVSSKPGVTSSGVKWSIQ